MNCYEREWLFFPIKKCHAWAGPMHVLDPSSGNISSKLSEPHRYGNHESLVQSHIYLLMYMYNISPTYIAVYLKVYVVIPTQPYSTTNLHSAKSERPPRDHTSSLPPSTVSRSPHHSSPTDPDPTLHSSNTCRGDTRPFALPRIPPHPRFCALPRARDPHLEYSSSLLGRGTLYHKNRSISYQKET